VKLSENISLKPYNTFGIDVKAKNFIEVVSVDELREVYNDKRFSADKKLILGGGSNLLFTGNFEGLVIKNAIKGIELINEDEDFYYIKAAAGESWHEFVMYCVNKNYAGLENLSLIPGNVGASPMQNIGAYGVEVKDVFYELEAFDVNKKTITKFNKEQCHFGYRESIFKREAKDKYVITSVTYKLGKQPVYNTSYGAIETELKQMGVVDLSVAAISKAVCNIRNSKLPNPKEIGNAGSFFKNPEVQKSKQEELLKAYPNIVSYSLENGNVKLAAGWLIEQCGLKGLRSGKTGVHKNQALVLVNYGNAKGQEIYDLSQKVLDAVKEKFGVELEREVNIIR